MKMIAMMMFDNAGEAQEEVRRAFLCMEG